MLPIGGMTSAAGFTSSVTVLLDPRNYSLWLSVWKITTGINYLMYLFNTKQTQGVRQQAFSMAMMEMSQTAEILNIVYSCSI